MKNILLICFLFCLAHGSVAQDSLQTDDKQWTLQECVRHALDNNLTIRRNELAVQQNEINLTEAKAARYPSLNAGAQSGYRWGRSIDPTSNLFVTRRIGSLGLSAGSSVTLFSGMQINNSITQNNLNVQAAEYDLEDARQRLTLDVVSFFLEVVFNQELVKNAERQLELTRAQLEKTRKLVDAGSLPVSNLLELEAEVASQEVALIQANNTLDLALLNLKHTLLIPAQTDFDIAVPEIDKEEFDMPAHSLPEIYNVALLTQPMIKSADIRMKSGEVGVKIAKGGYYPRLSLNGDVFTNYSDVAEMPNIPDGTHTERTEVIGFLTEDPSQTVSTTIIQPNYTIDERYTVSEQFADNLSQSVSINLSIPVFNGLSVRSNVQRAVIAREEAKINFEETRQLLRQNIETAYNDAISASKTYQASQKQVEALEESFRAIDKRYNLGASDFIDYQIAQNNLFTAQYELLRAKYEYVFRVKVLEFYMGETISF